MRSVAPPFDTSPQTQRVLPRSEYAWCGVPPGDLHDIASTRQIEQAFLASLPAHTLMQRAGLSVARLALALHPHAQTIWVACGPGNNGGDGLQAASHLYQWGKQVVVTWLGTPQRCSADTHASWEYARASGVPIASSPPAEFDLVIDALLGIGVAPEAPSERPPETSKKTAAGTHAERLASADRLAIAGQMADWVQLINQSGAPVLAIDLPSGLNADTGGTGSGTVRAQATLSLLTLKPGLFTGHGRDQSGDIWFDALGCDAAKVPGAQAVARLSAPRETAGRAQAPHASHKGSFGDVAVIGGAVGMTGAALLAASAALHCGAGRVYVSLLGSTSALDTTQPELMFRPVEALDLATVVVVCGCGGGDAVRHHLARVLSTAGRAVLDADALNAIAADTQLQTLLSLRAQRGHVTVLTPHPLEAARLLAGSVAQVQADRLGSAQRLAARFDCCVVLKGSGTVIAAPGQLPQVNPSGNALLATAGTGDVLAGAIGAALGHASGQSWLEAVANAVYRHGQAADQWPATRALTAAALAKSLHAP